MKVLIACEESQSECKAFRERGHEAYSCDIQDCSGGHPEWHIKRDVLEILQGGCDFVTMDGKLHRIEGRWDLIIAHPPCTYLSNVANRAFSLRVTSADKVVDRWDKRAKAVAFFMRLAFADCDKICIENPVGYMTVAYKKPTQYVEPWMFSDGVDDLENYHGKKTGLWIKGLPPLKPSGKVKAFDRSIYGKYSNGKNKTWEDTRHGSKQRSKSFDGISKAMAEQWG